LRGSAALMRRAGVTLPAPNGTNRVPRGLADGCRRPANGCQLFQLGQARADFLLAAKRLKS
jgi:hypothetical protein